jgi:hypothetical protein
MPKAGVASRMRESNPEAEFNINPEAEFNIMR